VPSSYINTGMTTSSLTPRLDVSHQLFGVSNRLLTGLDLYNTQYDSDRFPAPGTLAIHHYNIRQTTAGYYAMNTMSIRPDTDLSFGGRLQRNMIKADDAYNAAVDPNTGSYATNPQAPPLSSGEWQYAAHLGAEYRASSVLTLFGRAARAFRLANADERVGGGNPFGFVAPANFDLKTQTSYDVESGFRLKWTRFQFESSAYVMELNNEIHFLPALQQDVNLDPTQRVGWENSAAYQVADDVRLRGGAAYTHATFREGQFTGNDVPLVSRWSGNGGVTWDIRKKLLVLDVTARAWSARRMDNDQANIQPLIPANATVDVKLGGEIDRFFWSIAVQNLFNVSYFDYAIASGGSPASLFGPAVPSTLGAYNAYPLAARTFMARAGATF
jgi:iron complex outermembrane receptor protein